MWQQGWIAQINDGRIRVFFAKEKAQSGNMERRKRSWLRQHRQMKLDRVQDPGRNVAEFVHGGRL